MAAQSDPSSSAMGWRAALLVLAIVLGLTNLVELASTLRPGYWDSVGQIGIDGTLIHGKLSVSPNELRGGATRFMHQAASRAADFGAPISTGDLISVAPAAGATTGPALTPSVLDVFRIRERTEPIQLRVEHEGHSIVVDAKHSSPVDEAGLIQFYGQVFVDLIFAIVGGLLAWRRPGDKAIRALAIAMICWSSSIPATSEHPIFDLLWVINQLTARVWVDILLAYWAIHLSPESRWGISRQLRRVWPVWAVITIVLGILLRTAMYRPFPLGVDHLQAWVNFNQTLLYLAPLAALIEGVFSTQGEARTRIRWGLLIFGFHFFIYPYRIYLLPRLDVLWPNASVQNVADYLLQLVLPLGLLYATLRHRLLDLSFALNRGLVYGGISAAVLLVFFGLERVSEDLLKLQGREQNAMLAGSIAFAIFLFFHKMRDWVERAVERLFFSSWHRKESSLREYVRSAAHVTRIDSLLSSCVAAIDRFTDHAGSAIYRRDSDGNYQRLRASIADAPPMIDGNEPAILAMRVKRGPVTSADSDSSLPYECALPIIHRGEVDGFLLLNGKADREAYRPDQIELIAFAIQQIGLDLTALEREQYKQQAIELEIVATTARSSAEDMRGLLQLALARQAPSVSSDL